MARNIDEGKLRNQASEYAEQMRSNISDVTEQVRSKVSDMGEQVRSRVGDVTEQVQSRLRDMNIDETTIPDAFEHAPKLISPTVHAWLDVAVTGYFITLGAWFARRGRGGPATAAFINAGMVAGVSLMTDYHGTGRKPISFKMHGTLDAMQAAAAAMGPALHGFADEADAAFFYGQAINEVAVIATTDWNAGMPGGGRRELYAA